jgi:SagB-type dehydrogenase family enzyme
MRTAPSANGLHPLKITIATGPSRDLQSSVWRYEHSSSDLSLVIDKDVRKDLADSAIGDQNWIQDSPCIMTFFADIDAINHAFSTQPPLGKRGERYVYVEAGCAAQNAMLKATALGIGCTLVAGFNDRETSQHLRLEPGMTPLLHLCFGHTDRVTEALESG